MEFGEGPEDAFLLANYCVVSVPHPDFQTSHHIDVCVCYVGKVEELLGATIPPKKTTTL